MPWPSGKKTLLYCFWIRRYPRATSQTASHASPYHGKSSLQMQHNADRYQHRAKFSNLWCKSHFRDSLGIAGCSSDIWVHPGKFGTGGCFNKIRGITKGTIDLIFANKPDGSSRLLSALSVSAEWEFLWAGVILCICAYVAPSPRQL